MIDLVFVVDSSGSIRNTNPEDRSYDNWQLIKDFLAGITRLFHVNSVSTRDVTEVCARCRAVNCMRTVF